MLILILKLASPKFQSLHTKWGRYMPSRKRIPYYIVTSLKVFSPRPLAMVLLGYCRLLLVTAGYSCWLLPVTADYCRLFYGQRCQGLWSKHITIVQFSFLFCSPSTRFIDLHLSSPLCVKALQIFTQHQCAFFWAVINYKRELP